MKNSKNHPLSQNYGHYTWSFVLQKLKFVLQVWIGRWTDALHRSEPVCNTLISENPHYVICHHREIVKCVQYKNYPWIWCLYWWTKSYKRMAFDNAFPHSCYIDPANAAKPTTRNSACGWGTSEVCIGSVRERQNGPGMSVSVYVYVCVCVRVSMWCSS